MNRYPQNRPLVRVNKGCVSNLPEGCNSMNIATWNVRTLKDEKKIDILLYEMERLKIDILGISETHWNKDLPDTFKYGHYTIFNSHRQDNIHKQHELARERRI